MTTTHQPVINDQVSACTCRKWTGPARLPSENLGVFTNRAADLHRSHVSAVTSRPTQDQMFNPQFPLFQ